MDEKLFREAKKAYKQIKAPDRLAEKILAKTTEMHSVNANFDSKNILKRKRRRRISARCGVAACLAVMIISSNLLPQLFEEKMPSVYVNGELLTKDSTIVCEPKAKETSAYSDADAKGSVSPENSKTLDVEVKLKQEGKISVSDGSLSKGKKKTAETKQWNADPEKKATQTIKVKPDEKVCWSITNGDAASNLMPVQDGQKNAENVNEVQEYTLEVTENGQTVKLILRKNEETNVWEINRETK